MRYLPKSRRRLFIFIICLVVYTAAYVIASRLVAHENEKHSTIYFTFVLENPDTEHSLFLFFAPLIYIDEKLSGRKHRFDVDYLPPITFPWEGR